MAKIYKVPFCAKTLTPSAFKVKYGVQYKVFQTLYY